MSNRFPFLFTFLLPVPFPAAMTAPVLAHVVRPWATVTD